MRKTCASDVVCLATGQHVKGTLASGPLWERNMARELSGKSRPHRARDETVGHRLCCQVLPPVFRS